MIWSIYMATCPDGRAYIGCTSHTPRRRWATHCVPHWAKPNSPDEINSVASAQAYYGREAFVLEHIASAKGHEAAAEVEAALIKQHRTLWPHGFNRNRGGTGGFKTAGKTLARIEGVPA